MEKFDPEILKKLYIPPSSSHKGQNGKLLIIAGSELFHAPLLWTLKVASHIVDMVFFSSTIKNNEIAKKEFRDGIIVPRNKIEDYINEADCVLIGPGLPRKDGEQEGDDDTKNLTESLLKQYPEKKWVIDGGSLQAIDPQFIPPNAILTPHEKEFDLLFRNESRIKNPHFAKASRGKQESRKDKNHNSLFMIHDSVSEMAKKYSCTILLKGPTDIICGPFDSAQGETRCERVSGGNAGMTKGGTGDVLAGLVAGLYCKNDDPFLVAAFASYVNKKAGESLFKKVGYYFNASDLADEIPIVMEELII